MHSVEETSDQRWQY